MNTLRTMIFIGVAFWAGLSVGWAEDAPKPTVTHVAKLPAKTAPGGKAKIQHLARGRNAYLGRLQMQAGAKVPEHRDPTEEYIHVIEGSGTLYVDGQSHPVRPGTTIFMPAGAEVSFENGPEPMVALQIFAGPGPAAKYERWK